MADGLEDRAVADPFSFASFLATVNLGITAVFRFSSLPFPPLPFSA